MIVEYHASGVVLLEPQDGKTSVDANGTLRDLGVAFLDRFLVVIVGSEGKKLPREAKGIGKHMGVPQFILDIAVEHAADTGFGLVKAVEHVDAEPLVGGEAFSRQDLAEHIGFHVVVAGVPYFFANESSGSIFPTLTKWLSKDETSKPGVSVDTGGEFVEPSAVSGLVGDDRAYDPVFRRDLIAFDKDVSGTCNKTCAIICRQVTMFWLIL